MTLLKHKDKSIDVMIILSLSAFREVKMEFIKEYATVLEHIAIAFDRLQSDKFCFFECLLPTVFQCKKVKPIQCK